jgi:hypothetical protein
MRLYEQWLFWLNVALGAVNAAIYFYDPTALVSLIAACVNILAAGVAAIFLRRA